MLASCQKYSDKEQLAITAVEQAIQQKAQQYEYQPEGSEIKLGTRWDDLKRYDGIIVKHNYKVLLNGKRMSLSAAYIVDSTTSAMAPVSWEQQ